MRMSLRELMAEQSPGGKGLLAAEILEKTGRTSGPVDDRCEVCGREQKGPQSWLLADWIHWHCPTCARNAGWD
jgi:hypothetical protein